jgi:LacI family transcriptional regulator
MTTSADRRATTLRDVARHAGVSVSTASRALNGGRHVSEGLLERVQSAAGELGYRANEAARGLRMARTMTFGVIFPRLDSPVLLDVLDGMTDASEERGYTLLVTNARGDREQYRLLIRRLFERRVDALILANPVGARDELEPFLAARAPVISLFSRGEDCADIPLVRVDERQSIDEAVQRLHALGHRSAVYAAAEESLRTLRPAAIEEAMARLGMRHRRELLSDPPDEEALVALVQSVTFGPDRSTAIIASYRHLAPLLGVLGRLARRVPDDLSVLTFSDSVLTRLITPPIASIRSDTTELGRRAAVLMADWLDGAEPPNVSSLDLSSWSERPSVGPAPPRQEFAGAV